MSEVHGQKEVVSIMEKAGDMSSHFASETKQFYDIGHLNKLCFLICKIYILDSIILNNLKF